MAREQDSRRREEGADFVEAGPRLWEIFWRRKWLICIPLIVALGLGYLYYLQQEPVYQSSATILVTRTGSELPIGRGSDQDVWRERQATLSTQSLLIRSPQVIGLAVDGVEAPANDELSRLLHEVEEETGGPATALPPEEGRPANMLDLKELPTLKDAGDPSSVIISNLTVTPSASSSEVLELQYRCGDPQDCSVILEAVIASYRAYLKGKRDSVTREAVTLIGKAKDELARDLTIKEDQYREFRRENAHLLFTNADGANIHKSRMLQIEAARSELLLQRSQAEAQIQSITAARERGENREALLIMLDRYEAVQRPGRPAATALSGQLLPLLLEEQQLTQRFAKDHPKVIAIREKIELTRRFLSEEAGHTASEPEVDLLDAYIESLRQELVTLEIKEKELDKLFGQEQSSAKSLEQLEADDAAMRAEIARKQQLFDVIIKRLEEINLTNDLGGYEAAKITGASAGAQVEPSLWKVMAAASIVGLLLGLALAYLVDVADKRFRNPEEIERDLQAPLVGHIPKMSAGRLRASSNGVTLPSILCTFHQPMSRSSEAFRTVRTSLLFNTQADPRIIQVTSPSPGDGKSTLSANLAISMAQASKQVLLIDADFRRPTIHKLFNRPRSVGLSSLIKGEAEVSDAIQPTDVGNLSVMTCGPTVSNPAELLTLPSFQELLDVLRDRFDYIFVDSPPLLAVTDPSAVAPRMDGVLLVIQITKHSRRLAVKATETLIALGADVLGVVVNGAGPENGRGYGSPYRYDYRGGAYYYSRGYYSNTEEEPFAASLNENHNS